ncbi:MAG: CDP-alcohol phosphatidyltransferase family protein [Caulobacteraceae bacterium]|nr:CDP-alcohol phosphatidyltransferase family protein [Caulobacter sp.]
MSHDTVIHRLVRPAVKAARPLGVSPDQITVARLVTGVAAAALLAAGPGAWTAAGAGVFLVSALLDRADGELARQTGRFSAGGRRLDLWADAISTIAVFLGLGWGLLPALGWTAPTLGVLAGLSVAAVFPLSNRGGRSSPPLFASPQRTVVVDADDAMLLLPVLLWLGLGAPALVLAGTLTPIVALALAWRRGREAQAAARSPS